MLAMPEIDVSGPTGDYVTVVTKRQPENYAPHWWHRISYLHNASDDAAGDPTFATQSDFRGPFRLGNVTFSNGVNGSDPFHYPYVTGWSPSDSMARWKDGTSNQIIFAEQHIPREVPLGVVSSNPTTWWDATYIQAWPGHHFMGSARFVWWGEPVIARSPKDPPEGANWWGSYGLGSAHPGTINVAIGDGAVRGFSVSVSNDIVVDLSDVSDGKAVSLP
jgi:hypothetical protein